MIQRHDIQTRMSRAVIHNGVDALLGEVGDQGRTHPADPADPAVLSRRASARVYSALSSAIAGGEGWNCSSGARRSARTSPTRHS